jgi:hypothetical protein
MRFKLNLKKSRAISFRGIFKNIQQMGCGRSNIAQQAQEYHNYLGGFSKAQVFYKA